jgi:beta-1,4-mannosyltransferase
LKQLLLLLQQQELEVQLPGTAMKHVAVLVLGDLGRSPRMQYHGYSFANLNGAPTDSKTPLWNVSLIGYEGEGTTALVSNSKYITVYRLKLWDLPGLKFISILHAISKGVMLVLAVLSQLLQIPRYDLIIIQNPPCLPALVAAIAVSWFNGSRIMLDWHNLGFTMFQERLGARHPLVRLARLLEHALVSFATDHICVSAAMKAWLKINFQVDASVLYDRPPRIFLDRRLSALDRHQLLLRLGYTVSALFPHLADISAGEEAERFGRTIQTEEVQVGPSREVRLLEAPGEAQPSARSVDAAHSRVGLLMSCTSWTADEDFGLLLRALLLVELRLAEKEVAPEQRCSGYSRLAVVVTGKGPMKQEFEEAVRRHCAEGRLGRYVAVRTAWLAAADYPTLLRCADLGVSLHTSTSGLDLPMKVLDMFGSAVPVCAFDFPSLLELVQRGVNGLTFSTAEELAAQAIRLLIDPLPSAGAGSSARVDGTIDRAVTGLAELHALQDGAARISSWEDNWNETMVPILQSMFYLSIN